MALINGINKWDLLISSDWARHDQRAALQLIISEMSSVLNEKEQLMFAKVVILDKDEDTLSEVKSAAHIEQGIAEFSNRHFFGLDIKQAYLINS